jgi:hypothetical protein
MSSFFRFPTQKKTTTDKKPETNQTKLQTPIKETPAEEQDARPTRRV